MNVGEWLAMQAAAIIGLGSSVSPKPVSVAYKRPDGEDMIEIADECYVNRGAYEFGLGKAMPRAATGEVVRNAPIGNSLTPWRKWLEAEGKEWSAKWSWL